MKKKMKLIGVILTVLGVLTVVITMFSIDFHFENMVTVTEKRYDIKGDFNTLEITAKSTDVTILPSTNGKCSITTKCVDDAEITHSVKDGKLLIEKKEPDFTMFNFGRDGIVLYLTNEAYSTLKIVGSSGDTDISGVKFDTAEIDVSSGDVKITSDISNLDIGISSGDVFLKNSKFNFLSINGSTGDVELEDVEVVNGASIKASTADVKISNSKVEKTLSVELSTGELTVENASVGSLCAEATTGEIELENLISLGEIKLKVSSGDIELDGCDAGTLDIESSSGDVTGRLLSSKIFYVTSSTGEVSVPKSTEGGLCQVKTNTGDITFTILN